MGLAGATGVTLSPLSPVVPYTSSISSEKTAKNKGMHEGNHVKKFLTKNKKWCKLFTPWEKTLKGRVFLESLYRIPYVFGNSTSVSLLKKKLKREKNESSFDDTSKSR